MMALSTTEILQIVYDTLLNSALGIQVPTIYKYKHILNPSGEFIVVMPLANEINNSQVAVVNVNLYVPDKIETVNKKTQRFPDDKRLKELTRLALEALEAGYRTQERYWFRVISEEIISDDNISYSFSNIKIKLINY